MGPKQEDPEVLMKQKFRAKCRFRGIVRLVIANLHWLMDEEYEGENIQKRVEQAVRGRKKTQLLSVSDKGLLNKPAYLRTDYEMKYIYRTIGSLKCFKLYPKHVKRQLAAVTYYKYFGPGRVVIRENHQPHAMYFIVSGTVMVSHLEYDALDAEWVSVHKGPMFAGDVFGEVSLLHGIPRTATVTTTTHCELLVVLKDDFQRVLKATVQAQWDEVKMAMNHFSYFDSLDEVSRREGCIVAKLKSYRHSEVILGDGHGAPSFSYFIIEGRCQLIESLQVMKTVYQGKSVYSLCDPWDNKHEESVKLETEPEVDVSITERYDIKEKNFFSSVTNHPTLNESQRMSMAIEDAKHKVMSNKDAFLGDKKPSNKIDSSVTNASSSKKQMFASSASLPEKYVESIFNNRKLSVNDNETGTYVSKGNLIYKALESVQSVQSKIPLPVKRELCTIFMQVCQFRSGGSFNFGERTRGRRIVALTDVDILIMPRMWLLKHNTANIWTRIEHHIKKRLPNKEQLFKEFLSQKQWEQFQSDVVRKVLSGVERANPTSLHDVPYSIRSEEMVEF